MVFDLLRTPPAPPFDPLGVILAGREAVAAALEAADLPESGGKEKLTGFLWFTVGGENYAVENQRVKEVILPRRVTPVPRAPEAMTGILSHRGAIIGVMDLSARLGLEETLASALQRIIVVRMGEGLCGLLVNRVGRVIMRPITAVEPLPKELQGTEYEFVFGIIRYKGAQLLLLDLDKILDLGVRPT